MTDLSTLVAVSVALIGEHQAPSGAYVACPDFAPYRYSWLRDGAFVAEAMSRVGEAESADRFHGWCARVVTARSQRVDELLARAADGDTIAADDHLHSRYTVDGGEADDPWWNFQLDGYGLWLWALDRHVGRHGLSPRPYLAPVTTTVRYLAAFGDGPCYDWWEEHADQVHTATLASVAAGLRAVAGWEALPEETVGLAGDAADRILDRIGTDGVRDGHLTKWLGSRAVDASLVAAFVPLALFPIDGSLARTTIARIERELAPAGVHRYLDDVYYGGGEWVLLAGLLGSYHAAVGNELRARELLDWMGDQADADGRLPEQVNSHLLHPDHERRWIDRWGPSASPLLWSHAMLLTLADDLGLVAAPARTGLQEMA
jgi:GH15 family glucan-1,4-alpha-glucosidase